jgi:hypothetical protein
MPRTAILAHITSLAVALAAMGCTPPGAETGRDAGRRAADGGTASAHDAAADSGVTADDGATPVPTTDAAVVARPDPHPRLADIADNTAVDLGRYDTDCEARLGEGLRCRSIVSYSRFNYDPFSHRLLMFGGGHAATGRTDVDVFDLRTLTWASLYPSMTCAEIAVGDIDPRGFHRATGHPVARHTYDQNVIADVGSATTTTPRSERSRR